MLDIRCPSCGKESAISDSFAGREVTCPDCKEPYIAGSVRAARGSADLDFTSGGAQSAYRQRGPVGIGGWLVLPAIGLILGPLIHVFNIVQSLGVIGGPDMAMLEARFPGVQVAILAEVVASVGLLLFQLFTAVMFFQKKAIAPKLMMALYALNAGLGVLFAMWTSAVLKDVPQEVASGTSRAVIVAAIWIPYFLISQRVKATFVNP